MMTQPSDAELRAAIDALRTDAAMWRDMAAEMRAVAATAGILDLNDVHFSWLGGALGITETYQAIQARMIDVLIGGAANFDTVAQALGKAADAYEDDETRGVHRMRNIC